MKKIILLVLLSVLGLHSHAQIDLKKATSTASALGFDAGKIGKGIMDVLTPKLKLSADQTTKVTSLVSTFLNNKSSFAGLSQTKPAEYQTKFATEQKTLFDGLKGSIKPDQYTQFLGLKPAQTDKTNALTQLFY